MTFFPVTPFSRSLLLQVGVHINFQIYYTFFYSHLFVFYLLIGSLLVFVTHEAAMAQGMGRKPCVSPQQGVFTTRGATFMDSNQPTPMASPASHVASKYDLHLHRMHAHTTHLNETIPPCCRAPPYAKTACLQAVSKQIYSHETPNTFPLPIHHTLYPLPHSRRAPDIPCDQMSTQGRPRHQRRKPRASTDAAGN